MNICLHCQRFTLNPKFCSVSCSASYNNKTTRKRKLEGKCKNCGASIRSKLVYCSVCKAANSISDKTIAEVLYGNGANKYRRIRDHSRNKWLKPGSSCFVCGYSNHVEVCHIKPISSFPLDSRVNEVNACENIVLLCPNHHWELDSGLLVLSEFNAP